MTLAWRPSLQQLMELTGDVLDVPVSELATPEVLRRGRISLAAPNAEVHGVELYPDLPTKGAALGGGLLANPLPGRQVPRIACQVLRGFLHRNKWEWTVPVATTILRFESELRSGEIGPDLDAWIRKHSDPNPSGRSKADPQNWMRLFSTDDPTNTHTIFQAGPVTGLDAADEKIQVELGKRLEAAAADASQHAGAVFTVEHPSVRLSPQRSPGISDSELWQRNRRLMLSKADALFVADIGEHGPGVGAAMEIDLMASQGGPILYLRRKGRGASSRYFSGRGDELDLTIYDYRSPVDAADFARDWLGDRVNAIEEAGRRRVDRVYEGELLLRRLRPAYQTLEPDRRMFICGCLGVSPTCVEAALEDPATMSIVLGEKQTAFCELVGLEEGVSGEGMAEAIPSSPRADTLIEAAKIMGWDSERTHSTWNDAVREWETVPSDRRFRAQSVTDWIERGRD